MTFRIQFSNEKNELLKVTRGIGFDDIVDLIKSGDLLDDKQHSRSDKRHQRLYIIKVEDYAYVLPYVIDQTKKEVFLKTIYPSRKYTKLYLKKGES